MAVTQDTTYQYYSDGNNKALPLGIRDYSTDGKAMLVVSEVMNSNFFTQSGALDIDLMGPVPTMWFSNGAGHWGVLVPGL